MVLIKLKWNKLSFDDIDIDPSAGVLAFKQIIYGLTAVPLDRQKLMAKGAWSGTLKDDADLTKISFRDGQLVTLMGTAEVVEAPKENVVFVEDMTSGEKAVQGVIVPAGLRNMGNTCYMNSTVQCLRHMPELREALGPVMSRSGDNALLAVQIRELYKALDRVGDPFTPILFVSTLRNNYPQFAQTTRTGNFMQQDAEEFFNVLSQSLRDGLNNINSNFDALLGVTVEEELRCQETELEATSVRTERLSKVVCNIQGGPGMPNVDHLHEGVKIAFEGTIEKHSSVLGRNAVWTKKQRLSSLPKYLCFQFMRFFWKATPESRDHAGIKCKILRSVAFPETLDVYELCSASLQSRLRENRAKEDKDIEDALAAKQLKSNSDGVNTDVEPEGAVKAGASSTAYAGSGTTAASAPTPIGSKMEVDGVAADEDDEDAAALQAALAMSLGGAVADAPLPTPPTVSGAAMDVADLKPAAEASSSESMSSSSSSSSYFFDSNSGVPADFTGMYELHSIVTHKGRDADSGHYIGWVRQAEGSDYWWKYDDDVVTETRSEEVMKLKGGGDRDMAYLVFYRYKSSKKSL